MNVGCRDTGDGLRGLWAGMGRGAEGGVVCGVRERKFACFYRCCILIERLMELVRRIYIFMKEYRVESDGYIERAGIKKRSRNSLILKFILLSLARYSLNI